MGAESGVWKVKSGVWRVESGERRVRVLHLPMCGTRTEAYCTDDVSSLFNSLNTPYRCGTNTVEDGIKNISSILSKTVLTLYKIRV